MTSILEAGDQLEGLKTTFVVTGSHISPMRDPVGSPTKIMSQNPIKQDYPEKVVPVGCE